MKKILFVMGGLDVGGAEKILVDTLNALCVKYDVTLLLIFNKGKLISKLSPNIKIRTLLEPSSKAVKWFYRCLRYCDLKWIYSIFVPEEYDIEIAFLEGLATHFVGCSNKKSRKIAWVHTDMIENPWADVDYRSEQQQKRIYEKYNDIVCVSEYCRNQFIKRFDISDNVRVLYNILDDASIRQKASINCTNIINEKRAFCFVSSGRLIPQKGFDRLLNVSKRLHDDGMAFQLWIIGDGDMRSTLEGIISENDMHAYVTLLGYQSNPYPYMAIADAFVCSSRAEGLSTVVAEAFILGLPVVSVDCSGAQELLKNGQYGILTKNNEDALYLGMKTLINNSEIYKKYKDLSNIHGKDFSLDSRLTELKKFLNQ